MQGAISPGYKRTEAGVIPEDWEAIHLGSILKFKNGLNKAKEYFGHGHPIVNYMDVFNLSGLRSNDVQGLVEVNADERKSYSVQKGDVFFTRTSETVEEIGLSSVMLSESKNTVFSGFVLRGRPVDDRLDDQFKRYCFSASYLRQQIVAKASYTTRALTNGRSLSATILACPPLPEQRSIAAALADADALIAALEGMIAKKRDLRQAAMQHLLTGETRLPGFSGEWEVTLLGDLERSRLVQLGRGKVISKLDIDREPGVNPIYSSSVQLSGLFGRYKKYMFNEEMITWSVDGGGHFFYRPKHKFSVTNVCGFMRVEKSALNCMFLAGQLQLLHGKLKFDYQDKAHPSVIRKAYKLAVPSIEEQTAIAEVFSDMDVDLAALQAQATKARAVKQGMMQELLTGRVRLV